MTFVEPYIFCIVEVSLSGWYTFQVLEITVKQM